jgi:hypothetical protein
LVDVGCVHPEGTVKVTDELAANVLAAGAVNVNARVFVVDPATTDPVVAVMVP